MHRAKVCLAGLLWLSLVAVASAQTIDNQSGVVVLDPVGGSTLVEGTYFDVRTMTGDGVGYQHGYTQLGLFTPFWVNDNTYIAAQKRLFITDTGFLGGNAGFVARTYSSDLDRIFGVNGYFDYDRSTNGNTYRQFTIGAETLGKSLDFRVNGYLPTNTSDHFVGPVGILNDPRYLGNRIVVTGFGQFEQSLRGADFEFGAPIFGAAPWLRAYAGMYAYNSRGKDPVGVRARVDANVSDDLLVGFQYTDDAVYGGNLNAIVDFRFSGFKPTRYFPQWNTRERMMTQVQRNWRVATAQRTAQTTVDVYNPADNQPYFVVHVDPGAAGGNGTYENPYGTMPANAPGADLILVQRGNTTETNPLNSSIVLENNQRLLGEGLAHQYDYYAYFGRFGVSGTGAVLPNFNNVGVMQQNYMFPFLTSTGNAVTLANNNEVSGFAIGNSVGAAITGNGITNFNLNGLEIYNNNGGGITLANASGSGVISNINTNPVISGDAPPALFVNPTFGGNGGPGGIVIDSGAAPLTLALTNVRMNNNTGAGISVTADNGVTNRVTATNIEANGNTVDGIDLTANNGSTLVVTAEKLRVQGNGNNGVNVQADNGTVNMLLTDNTATGNDLSGNGSDNLFINVDNGGVFTGFLASPILDGSLTGSGLNLQANNGSTANLRLSGASASGNFLNGLTSNATNGSAIVLQMTGGSAVGNGQDAFNLSVADTSYTNFFTANVDATFSGRDGLNFNLAPQGRLDASLFNTQLDNSGRSAVFGTADSARARVGLSGVTGNFSGQDGIHVVAVNGSDVGFSIVDSSFSDSGQAAGGDGIDISSDASRVSLNLARTNVANFAPNATQDDGLFLNLTNGSIFSSTITSSNLGNNSGNAIDATITNNTRADFNIASTEMSGSGLDGLRFNLDQNGQLNATIDGSNLNNSGVANVIGQGDGLTVTENNGSKANLLIINSSISNSYENGARFSNATGSALNATFVNDIMTGNGLANGDNGIRLVSDNASALLNVFATTVSGSGGDGLYLGAQNGANEQVNIVGSTLSDSGQTVAGASIEAQADTNSLINLQVINSQLTNSTPNTPQQQGFLFNAAGGGDIYAQFAGSNLSSQAGEGIAGQVDGNGSTASIFLNNTTVDSNGSYGILFNVINGGDLALITSNGTSISNNAADGVFAVIDGPGSTGYFEFDDTTIDNNGQVFGGDGVNINPINGGMATVVFNNTSVSGNADQGFDIVVDNGGTMNYTINNGTFDNNGGEGIRFVVTDGTLNLSMNGTSISNNGQTGIAAGLDGTVDGPTAVANVIVQNTTIDGNSGAGIALNDVNGGQLTTWLGPNTTFSNNGADGLNLNVSDAGTAAYLGLFGPITADNNGGDGLDLFVHNGARLDVKSTGGLDASNNAGNGLFFRAAGPGTLYSLLMFNTDGINNFNGNTLDGINVNVSNIPNGPPYQTIQLQGNASNNQLNGIDVNLLNSNAQLVYTGGTIDSNLIDGINIGLNNSDLVVSSRIQNATITNNLGRGVDILGVANPDVVMAFTGDTITGNGAEGVRYQSNSGTLEISFGGATTADSNTISNNGGAGVLIGLNHANPVFNPNTANVRFDGNDISNNGGPGIDLELAQNTNLNFSMGTLGASDNGIQGTMTANTDAGILLNQTGTSTATFVARNVAISGTVNGTNPLAAGDGILLNLVDSSSLNNAVIGQVGVDNTSISTNASHGIEAFVTSFATLTNTTINNVDLLNNTGDGIHFNRAANGMILNTRILGNNIVGNSDGIDISARAANTTDTYLIDRNNISTNSGRGVSLFVEADADIDVGITNNTISNNGDDGIQMRGNLGTTDNGQITSLIGGARPGIQNNTINGNGGDGIDIGTVHQVNIDTNTIDNNTGNGILISGSSNGQNNFDTINNNEIVGNGVNGVFINSVGLNNVLITSNSINNSGNDGVSLSSTGARLRALVDGNAIFNSGGDGIQLSAVGSGQAGIGPNVVQITGNSIQQSNNRGINVVNGGNASTVLNIGDGTAAGANFVERSGLEGVYIVNTASTNQNADALANTALDATGSIFATPFLTLNVDTNFIRGNGTRTASTFDTTGLVVRVGTADGGQDFTDPGGFANTRAGVVATINNNQFGGQFGADVTFQSFVSTVNPNTTGGAWTDQNENPRNDANNAFTPGGYQSDPLARLDLIFTNNIGEGLIATRTGAAYTNDESVFKSRTQGQDTGADAPGPDGDDDGPFGAGTRPRNAQRLARRQDTAFPQGQLPPALTIANSDSFLFPGVGQSTFRVRSSGNAFANGVGFFLDNNPYTGVNSANGVGGPNGGPNGIDNMPFGWSVLP